MVERRGKPEKKKMIKWLSLVDSGVFCYRYYVQLPLPLAHEYHEVDDIPMDPDEGDSQGQRLNPEVMHKIRELVARGVTGIYTVKHCLKEYVEKELFINLEPPPRHNKSYFPTIIDIQNHIHQAQMALATGALVPLPPVSWLVAEVVFSFCMLLFH